MRVNLFILKTCVEEDSLGHLIRKVIFVLSEGKRGVICLVFELIRTPIGGL